MFIRQGEPLRLTLWHAGQRAAVSLNTFAVTEHVIEGVEPALDGFTHDLTRWLGVGRNVLSVVLIGPPGPRPFRMTVDAGRAGWTFDETEQLPWEAPWRLFSREIEVMDEATWRAQVLPWPPTIARPSSVNAVSP